MTLSLSQLSRFTQRCLLLGVLWWGIVHVASTPASGATMRYAQGTGGITIEHVDPTCPMIYDNDWWSDTPGKYYLWAKASLGRADLRGNIVTRDMWDWKKGYFYSLRQGMEQAVEAVEIARRSGLKNIPDPIVGCNRAFTRPSSGKIEDTTVVPNPGSELIVAEARKASVDKPLLIFVGGPLNTVANAYLMDPSIATKIVVFMTDLQGYNGKDPWANFIVARRCKLVNYGAHVWWPQRPEPPVMPLERFDDLPANEMTQDIRRIAQMFWDRSTKNEKPDRDDGFGDAAPIFLVFEPRTWQQVQRQRVEGIFEVKDVDGRSFDLLDAREVDYDLMADLFFSQMKDPAIYGRNGLAVAFGLPRIVATNTYMSRGLVVEAVYEATRLSGSAGRVIKTGTLEVTAKGTRYRRVPDDRLILTFGDQRYEFVVTEAQGDASATTAAAWLLLPHRLEYTVRVPEQAESDVSVRFNGRHFNIGVKGWTTLGPERYTVDLKASGQSASAWDMHGRQMRTEYSLTGKVQGQQMDIAVDVNEQHISNMAAATNLRLLYSMRGSASRFSATLNNRMQVGGDEYTFDGVRIQTDVIERGGQGRMRLTDVSGQVLRNGRTYGHCVLKARRPVLETDEGPIALDLVSDGS